MITVGVDSSSQSGSCAILRDGELLAQGFVNNGLTHSQTLLPMIMDVFQRARVTPLQVDLYSVTTGPGSFTGLRIGIATVMGLAAARGTDCVGISTLEAAAYSALQQPTGSIICAALDARCRRAYNALFELREGGLFRMCEDRVIELDNLKKILKDSKKSVFLVGDAAQMCYNEFQDIPGVQQLGCFVQGDAVAALGALRASSAGPASALRPQYIQLPQAQRELLSRRSEA